MSQLNSDLFISVSKIIVLASIAFGAIQVLRSKESPEHLTICATISLLGIVFAHAYFSALRSLSVDLDSFIRSAGTGDSISQIFSRLIHNATANNPPELPTMDRDTGLSMAHLNMLGSALKTGVWGVITLIIEFLFMILGEVLEALSLTLIQIIQIVFPLGAALYAARPGILKNLLLYSIELSLWLPCLSLVRGVVGLVSKHYLEGGEAAGNPDLGLKMVAVQLAAIVLFAGIPKFVHSILSGSIASDMGLSPSSVFRPMAGPVMAKAKVMMGPASKTLGLLALVVAGMSAHAAPINTVKLYPGYVTKIVCKGRLLVSAVGDDQIVQKSALPNDLGCGLLLKPLLASKRTNLILETSTGTIKQSLEITKSGIEQPSNEVVIALEAGEE